jgi:hypothetical protein
MRRLRRLTAAVTLTLVAASALAGCGGGSSSSGGATATKVIDITITGESTDPSGTVIDVAVGQPIELDVTADKPGEIHVHSSPEEQEFQYGVGKTTLTVKPIQAPGRVVVESHTLEKTILTLQAK